MGQKVHPYGFRLGVNRSWHSNWIAKREYADLLHEDLKLKRRQQAEDHHSHLAPRHHHRAQGRGDR
jgi:small subunit ribosomal protein S3